jgi:hypothetical protein
MAAALHAAAGELPGRRGRGEDNVVAFECRVTVQQSPDRIFRALLASLAGHPVAGLTAPPFAWLTADSTLQQHAERSLEIVDVVPALRIAWQCRHGVEHAGIVRLEPAASGCQVRLYLATATQQAGAAPSNPGVLLQKLLRQALPGSDQEMPPLAGHVDCQG